MARPITAGSTAWQRRIASAFAAHAFTIGLSDQKTGMWQDPRFATLGIKQVRLLMAYDNVLRRDFSRYDAWMAAAKGRIRNIDVKGGNHYLAGQPALVEQVADAMAGWMQEL